MMSFIRPRWRKPAWTLLAGAVLTAAWLIRGGPHWWLWMSLTVIAAAARAFTFYRWGGNDDDVGALAGEDPAGDISPHAPVALHDRRLTAAEPGLSPAGTGRPPS